MELSEERLDRERPGGKAGRGRVEQCLENRNGLLVVALYDEQLRSHQGGFDGAGPRQRFKGVLDLRECTSRITDLPEYACGMTGRGMRLLR